MGKSEHERVFVSNCNYKMRDQHGIEYNSIANQNKRCTWYHKHYLYMLKALVEETRQAEERGKKIFLFLIKKSIAY